MESKSRLVDASVHCLVLCMDAALLRNVSEDCSKPIGITKLSLSHIRPHLCLVRLARTQSLLSACDSGDSLAL